MFRAIVIDKDNDTCQVSLTEIDDSELPDGDVTVNISYSTLNYKDALAIMGKPGVVRSYPMVPGIDFAGEVLDSSYEGIQAGDQVILNGWGVGEAHWGGLAQKARLPGQWLVPLPQGLSAWQSMVIGTAGYTAMLCILRLEQLGITPASGPVLVTGAAGGVGSVAVAVLSDLGYQVEACTGRPHEATYLKALGASSILDRTGMCVPGRPLAAQRWAAAIDSVGSHTLANVCAGIHYGGVVAACGLAQGMDFPATVAPFILRNITLAGVDSVMRPQADRLEAWSRLATDLSADKLALIGAQEVALGDVPGLAAELLAGKVRGRIVVDVNR